MTIAFYPVTYYSVLPVSTLTTKIREKNWNLDRLFPLIYQTKKQLERLMMSLKSKADDLPILEFKHKIGLLAAEIRAGIRDLKLINFYDSAILYLYFRLLDQIYSLCKKEIERLTEEEKVALSEKTKLKTQKLDEIRRAKKNIEKRIKEHERIIKGLAIGEKELIGISAQLLSELRKLRWKTEKQAQHEFSFSKFTFRSLSNLNRKIKTEVIKVKKLLPQEKEFVERIKRKPLPEDVSSLAKIAAEAIKRISKDVAYSSKLISKFLREFERLKAIVQSLKKTIRNKRKITQEAAKSMMESWDHAVIYVEKEVDKDLMEIFRNIFVEYKKVGTSELLKAA